MDLTGMAPARAASSAKTLRSPLTPEAPPPQRPILSGSRATPSPGPCGTCIVPRTVRPMTPSFDHIPGKLHGMGIKRMRQGGRRGREV